MAINWEWNIQPIKTIIPQKFMVLMKLFLFFGHAMRHAGS